MIEVPCGAGRLIWCPLPVELSERGEALLALYRHAMAAAGCRDTLEWLDGGDLPGVFGRLLRLSEHARDARIAVRDMETGAEYRFTLERERAMLFATDCEGRVTCVYRGEEKNIYRSSDRRAMYSLRHNRWRRVYVARSFQRRCPSSRWVNERISKQTSI